MTQLMRNNLLLAAALLLLPPWGDAFAASAKKISPLSDSIRKVRKAPPLSAREAFRKFTGRHGNDWKVRYSPRTALPEALTGGASIRYAGTPEQAAEAFFNDNKDLLKADPQALRLVNKKEFLGVTHLQYQQYKDGLPVEFSYARVHITSDGRVSGYQGKFEPDLDAFPAPAVAESAAVMAAAADLGRPLPATRVELVIFPDEESGERRLAWKIKGRNNGLWVYYVDAANARVLLKYDALHRAGCPGYTGAIGTSSAAVYEISPIPTDPSSGNLDFPSWSAGPVNRSLRDQYVWAGSYSSRTVTNAYGDYCTNQGGKAFSSLKGPYFSVTNFRGESARWSNGTLESATPSTPLQSPHPYENSQEYSYSVTVPDSWTGAGWKFAMALPRFTAFNVGELDIFGSLNDADQVQILSGGLSGNSIVGSYTGLRRNAFYGASVEDPSFTVKLRTDEAGTYNGFIMDHTKVLMLGAGHDITSNGTGSVLWSPGQSGVYLDTGLGNTNALAEANVFYHLNKARRYFDTLNIDPVSGNPPADLSRRVPVMVHAHGDADLVGQSCGIGCGGMLNAYYDLENDNIMIGDGPMDAYGNYRNFALDGTIVRHEYIHLVVNRIYPIINYGEFGAISEAMADYFSLASFWSDTCSGCSTLTKLGNFIGAGEASTRDLSGAAPTGVRVMPDDWWGQVHEDSLPLSQALYSMKTGGSRSLGDFATGAYAGLRKSDVLTYAALFYFPDTFANFKDAMLDACRQFNTRWAGSCDTAAQNSIALAFSDHGIGTFSGGDIYERSATSLLCTSNNGPECAAELEDATSISATIYPLSDVDYYSLPLAAGNFTARLDLPPGSQDGTYTAYAMFLFDANRDYVAEAVPDIYNTYDGYCPAGGDCLTLSKSVTLSYTVPRAGRYYLVVAAAPNEYYGNSEANSQLPYTLTLDRSPAGSAAARIYAASYDNDEISFDVPYSFFAALIWPSSQTIANACSVTGAAGCPEQFFEYAQLRDHNYAPLDLTRTNLTGAYMADVPTARAFATDSFGISYVSGRVKLQPGFGARYPGVGTIHLELFGRNHLGHIVSLGVSNPVNLSAGAAEATAYNNIITAAGGSAIIKYAVTSPGSLSIKVYTQSGSLVKTVFDGPVPAGKGTVDWDGTNSSGGKAASGIYFVKTKGPGLDRVVKVAVVR